MNVAIGNVASGNPNLGRRRWWLLVPVLILNLLSACFFLGFLGAAFFYSDRGPLTSTTPASKVAELTYASHRAHVFFLYAVVAVALAALLTAPVIQLKRFKLPGRYVLALVLCILAVGALVHVFFVYSAVVAALVALLMTPAVQDRFGPNRFTLVIRYLLGLVLCVLTTGLLVWILGVVKWP